MEKEKRILIYFISFILGLLTTMIIGLSNVFAEEIIYENIGYITNNTETYISNGEGQDLQILSGVNHNIEIEPKYYFIYTINYNFESNYTYQLELSTPNAKFTGVDSVIVQGYDSSDNLTSCNFVSFEDESIGYPKIYFNCPSNVTSISINLGNSSGYAILTGSSYRWNYAYLRKSVTLTGGDNQIIQNQNEQIIDQNNQIIQGQDDIKDAIIDSNKETQEVIKDTFEDCSDSVNLFRLPDEQTINGVTFSKNNDGTFNLKGTVSASADFSVYVDLLTSGVGLGKTYTLSTNTTGFRIQVVTYSDDTWISTPFNRTSDSDVTKITSTMSTNSSINRIRYMISVESGTTINLSNIEVQFEEGSSASSFEPFGQEICKNKIDETNEKLDSIEGALTDSSPTDMSGLGDSAGWLPAGPVDSILTLPLTMLNSLVSNLTNNSCQTISVELPFVKENITLPCVRSLYDKMGVTGTLFTTAGLIASAFILFNYLLALYKWVDDTLTMRENTMPGYFDDNWGGGA